MTAHVVQFSGGIGSFCAAVRVAEKHGTDRMVLLIADTGIEDPDLWRFADDTSKLLDVPLTKVSDGRTPADTVAYIGIENSKRDRTRIPAIARNWKPWRTQYPLCAKREPARTKTELLDEARALGVEPPRLYELGFEHNNCGGTCVRAGQKQWKRTLDVLPNRFARAEAEEESLRKLMGDVSILRQRRKGTAYPLPLAELRRQHHAAPMLPDIAH